MKLESYKPDSEVVVVRNENYWGGDIKLDKADLNSADAPAYVL